MGQFQIRNQQNMGYTLIANPFIDEFLADANDIQIKVYLYILRHQNTPEKCSISSMADFFNYSEKDVLRGLSYWEKKKILQLDYDSGNELIGVTLCPFSTVQNQMEEVRSTPFVAKTPTSSPVESKERPSVKTVAYMSNAATFVKPEYTLDQLYRLFWMRIILLIL